MKRLVVGVMGHVDHGKTALVRAISGIETDRLVEEKQRGISIALGFAHFSPVPGTVIDLIDMPGHERFIRTMISGASGIDAVLLVVAANEGLRPQSREHAQIAALLGISHAVLAISKCDLVSPAEAEAMADEARRMLESLGFTVSACVMTSLPLGRGLDAAGKALASMASIAPPREADGLAFLPVDRAFAIAGHGPVVTGTLRGAALAVGDSLSLLPSGRSVRIRALQSNGKSVQKALPGQRVAANLRSVGMADLDRGMALASPDSLLPTRWLAIRLRSLDEGLTLRNGMAVHVAFATTSVAARLRLLDRDELMPGEVALAQVHLAAPCFLPPGEHVVLRQADLSRTLGGGVVIDNFDRRFRRNAPPVLERLSGLASGPLNAIVAREIEAAGTRGTSLAQLARLTGKAPWRVAQAAEAASGSITRGGMVLAAGETRRRLALKAQARETDRQVDDSALAAQLAAAGLTPPTPRELLGDPQIASGVHRLLRRGVLVRATDRAKGKELFFHADAIAAARDALAPRLAVPPGLTVSEIAAALGISRKFVMPLLDHLDSSGFTRRVGDLRVLAGTLRPGDEPTGHG